MESKLPLKTLLLWKIRVCVLCGILAVACALFYYISYWFFAGSAFFAFLAILLAFIYVPKYYQGFTLSVTDTAIIIKSGVIFRFTTVFPYKRLIFASCLTTPLAKKMGVSAVVLRAARGIVFVPEIEINDAFELVNGLAGEKNEKKV